MTEHTHAHPLPDGRRFEHVHRLAPVCPSCGSTVTHWRELPEPPYGWACPECGAPLPDHGAIPLAEAHPDMADVAQAPAPGSPADLHQQALFAREQAAWHRARADEYERRAAELDAQAERDRQHPPDESERVRRLLEGGLW